MIWLAGAKGMLGGEIAQRLRARHLPHVATDREVDVTDGAAVLAFANRHRPTWILNAAAYTAVDQAEREEEEARRVNAEGPGHLAEAAEETNARLVHVSTDYVFDGEKEGPYQEEDAVAPLGAYGRTKEEGERRIREVTARHVIVRTAWLHGPGGPNFVATMLRLMAERPSLRVVSDQRGSPTYAGDLADALLAFVTRDREDFGTYHYANTGETTWHGFAEAIQREALARGLLARPIPIEPIPSEAYPTPARRPRNSVLATERIRGTLELAIPSWQEGLSRHLDVLSRSHRTR